MMKSLEHSVVHCKDYHVDWMAMVIKSTVSENMMHLLKLGSACDNLVKVFEVWALLNIVAGPATVSDLLTVEREILSTGNGSKGRK